MGRRKLSDTERRVKVTITIYKPLVDFAKDKDINISKIAELGLIKYIKRKFNVEIIPPDLKRKFELMKLRGESIE